MDDHRITLEQLVRRLETNTTVGLTDEEAKKRLEFYGKNKMSEPPKQSLILKFLKEITNMFALLLWAGGALCIIAYRLAPEDPSNLYLGLILFVIVLITGTVTFF